MATKDLPSGTKLPLLNLKGKDYLQVAHRLVWYREVFPKGRITTCALERTEEHAIFQASVTDNEGNFLANGTKKETKEGFADFIEKAETGAVGRALAMAGFGTQFAPEFDEAERIVDSPVTRPTKERVTEAKVVPKTSNSEGVLEQTIRSYLNVAEKQKKTTMDKFKEYLKITYSKEKLKDLSKENQERVLTYLKEIVNG